MLQIHIVKLRAERYCNSAQLGDSVVSFHLGLGGVREL